MTPSERVNADPNAPVKLRGGATVPAPIARTTFITLEKLSTGDITDVLSVYEAKALAADPGHDMWPGTAECLQAYKLLDANGKMHESVRMVVLAAVEGDAEDMRVVWPFEDAPGS